MAEMFPGNAWKHGEVQIGLELARVGGGASALCHPTTLRWFLPGWGGGGDLRRRFRDPPPHSPDCQPHCRPSSRHICLNETRGGESLRGVGVPLSLLTLDPFKRAVNTQPPSLSVAAQPPLSAPLSDICSSCGRTSRTVVWLYFVSVAASSPGSPREASRESCYGHPECAGAPNV
ncbi:hypothetical protein DPEC_G00172740 [Dallia pectoralis]|uniref:Uncharacterized protein n=1 Tax=Dallia pectoralis TaxID=75939 RepID=A0ACC2GDL2_DALPE|nr:hypothetical protein DPEC_G00172740 [Dallia pectoralis]